MAMSMTESKLIEREVVSNLNFKIKVELELEVELSCWGCTRSPHHDSQLALATAYPLKNHFQQHSSHQTFRWFKIFI